MKKDSEDRRRRMQKLLAVALSTSEPGECHGAMQALKRVLEADGRTVQWLLGRLNLAPAPAAPFIFGAGTARNMPPWYEQLNYLGEDHSLLMLAERELEFIMSLKKQDRSRERFHPTGRQMQWLESIYQRVKVVRGLTA